MERGGGAGWGCRTGPLHRAWLFSKLPAPRLPPGQTRRPSSQARRAAGPEGEGLFQGSEQTGGWDAYADTALVTTIQAGWRAGGLTMQQLLASQRPGPPAPTLTRSLGVHSGLDTRAPA